MTSDEHPSLVKGEILLSKELGSFYGATAHVYLEDVTLLDAAAKVIAKQMIANLNHEAGTENRVEFSLPSAIVEFRARYSIRAHITLYNDEQIHCGDYISTESYPVLTDGYPNQVLINVTEVK